MRCARSADFDVRPRPPAAWARFAGGVAAAGGRRRRVRRHLARASCGRGHLSRRPVAFYLPMHTATRLAASLIDRVRLVNPAATVAAYGLYAPLNAAWLRERGVGHVIGPEAESELVALACTGSQLSTGEDRVAASGLQTGPSHERARVPLIQPDRAGLPPLSRYAALQMPDGTSRAWSATPTRRAGCKHLCRHCPIVPVYRGTFRAVPLDVVMDDVRAQVAAGAQHITFGDPGLLQRADARPTARRAAGRGVPGGHATTSRSRSSTCSRMRTCCRCCATRAVCSSPAPWSRWTTPCCAKLRKGHTRADFVRAVGLCREAGLTLVADLRAVHPVDDAGGLRRSAGARSTRSIWSSRWRRSSSPSGCW